MTTLDNRRTELDTRIGWSQEEIDALQAQTQKEIDALQAQAQKEIDALRAKLDRLKAERRELDNYVPAVDPETGEVR